MIYPYVRFLASAKVFRPKEA